MNINVRVIAVIGWRIAVLVAIDNLFTFGILTAAVLINTVPAFIRCTQVNGWI